MYDIGGLYIVNKYHSYDHVESIYIYIFLLVL